MGFSRPWSSRKADNSSTSGSNDQGSKERAQAPPSAPPSAPPAPTTPGGGRPVSSMRQPEKPQRLSTDDRTDSAPPNRVSPASYQPSDQPGPSSPSHHSGWNGPPPHDPASFAPHQHPHFHTDPQNTPPPPPYAEHPPPILEPPNLFPRHDPPTRVIHHLQGTLKYWPAAPLPPPPPSVWTPYEPPGTYGSFQGRNVVPQYMLPPPDLRDYDMSWLCAIRCLPAWTRSVEEEHWNQVRRNRNLIAMGMPPEQGKDECCLM
ncbi:MAG: hypothetical protein Q9167_004769 [Letrouitia subvulpina]